MAIGGMLMLTDSYGDFSATYRNLVNFCIGSFV